MKGFRRRNRLTHQLLAEVVYSAMFAVRDSGGKTVADIFPQLFENEEEEVEELTDDDIKELEALASSW